MIALAVPPQWRPAPHPTARADAAKALKLGHYPADGWVDYIYPIAGGTKPADLPIEQPTRFELSVNVRVARDLGITLTPTILACAEEVIE